MGRLLAQELELMRSEVDHEQSAAWLEQPRGLRNRRSGVVEEVQDLMQDHRVGCAIGQRHVVEIAVAGLSMTEPGAFELHARIPKHVAAQIEAERAGR